MRRALIASSSPFAARVDARPLRASTHLSRALLVAVTLSALGFGLVITGSDAGALAAARAGEDLTRLLRAMAAIKALLAACATLGVLWRLGAPIAPGRWLLYAGACAAMAAGPGLIWHMEHVRTGAALLHGGLLAAVVALFRDPAVGDLLRSLTSRRAAK